MKVPGPVIFPGVGALHLGHVCWFSFCSLLLVTIFKAESVSWRARFERPPATKVAKDLQVDLRSRVGPPPLACLNHVQRRVAPMSIFKLGSCGY